MYQDSLAEAKKIPIRALGYIAVRRRRTEDKASGVTENTIIHVCVFYYRVCIVPLAIQN